jgi:hypothetical protein
VDLFATRLNTQLSRFVSWQPDPDAEAIDAFMLDWREHSCYVFPPFSIVNRCLQKLAEDQVAACLLVVLVWPTQPWFAQLLRMLIDIPLLLPFRKDILSMPGTSKQVSPLKVRLMACVCSGRLSSAEEFRQRQPTSSSYLGDKVLGCNIGASLNAGLPIVVRNKLIFFNRM